MMARPFLAATSLVLAGVCVGFAWPQAETPPASEATIENRAGDVFVATAAAFDDAYNAHDPESIAAMFAENGELVIDERAIVGRDAIREAFAAHFAEFPESSIRTEIDAIRLPSPMVAIEEGRTVALRSADEPAIERQYVMVHARSGDAWTIASVREEAPEPETPGEALQQLAWLVGDWIDESDDATVETSCRWSDDGNWLLQDYRVHLHGGPEMSGTQRIGWDASREQIRSWSFDSLGGFIEGVWEFDGERWTAQLNGVSNEGALGSGTRIITRLGPDAFLLQSFHRVFDGDALPDSEVTVVRRPPAGDAETPPDEESEQTVPEPLPDPSPQPKAN
jgi:uncharacterized protein (TIGR02246 family)